MKKLIYSQEDVDLIVSLEIEKLEDNWNKLKQWCIKSRDTERKEKWNLVKLNKDLEPIIENDILLYDKFLKVMRDLESKGE